MHTYKRTLHRSIGSKGHSGTSAGHRHKSLCTEDRCGNRGGRGIKGLTRTVALIHCNCHITVENSQACSPLRLQSAQRMLKLQLVEVKNCKNQTCSQELHNQVRSENRFWFYLLSRVTIMLINCINFCP